MAGRHETTAAVPDLLSREDAEGLRTPERYARFAEDVKESKRALLDLLIRLRREEAGRRLRGAPGRGTRFNFCGIRTDLLDFTVDRNPYKHGLYTPGTHIPIHPPEHIEETRPDYLLVLPGTWWTRSRPNSRTSPSGGRSSSSPSRSRPSSSRAPVRRVVSREGGVKVVIFCGGLGVRMGDATQRIPKPMITVGTQPILWHIMKWYAGWGHSDFVLCLGYRGEIVKEYFLEYNEALANDFVLSNGGRDVELLGADISDWRITFVDTGAQATIGERLKAVESYIDEPVFLATYGDGLTDAPRRDGRDARAEREDGPVRLGAPEARGTTCVVDAATATASSSRSRASRTRTFGSTGVLRVPP